MKKIYSKIEFRIISLTDPDVLTLSAGGDNGDAIELDWNDWNPEIYQ